MKTLKVSEDVWYAAKLQAVKTNVSLQKFAELALWEYIGKKEAEKQ